MEFGVISPSFPKFSLMEDQSISKKGSAPARDSTYYIADGNVVILVENILFKV